MKWIDHKQEWQDCQRCELKDQRKHVILLRGKIPCDVLFIGEAPGQSEDVIGKPFVGPAGKMLDRIIKEGLNDDTRWAMTNLVGCFPKEAKQDRAKSNEPPKKAILACKPRLVQLIKMCNPEVIVCVGKLSGSWSRIHLRKCFKGYFEEITHPAAILRMDTSQRNLAYRWCVETLQNL